MFIIIVLLRSIVHSFVVCLHQLVFTDFDIHTSLIDVKKTYDTIVCDLKNISKTYALMTFQYCLCYTRQAQATTIELYGVITGFTNKLKIASKCKVYQYSTLNRQKLDLFRRFLQINFIFWIMFTYCPEIVTFFRKLIWMRYSNNGRNNSRRQRGII